MKKVKIIVSLVIIFVIVAGVGLFFLLKGKTGDKKPSKAASGQSGTASSQLSEDEKALYAVFDFENVDEMAEYAKKNKCEYYAEENYHNLCDVKLFGYEAQIFYLYDANGTALERKAIIPLNVDSNKKDHFTYKDLSDKEIKNICEEFLGTFSKIFVDDFKDKTYIISSEGKISQFSDATSFKDLKNSTARIEYMADHFDMSWRITFSFVEEAMICEIEMRYIDIFGEENIADIVS